MRAVSRQLETLITPDDDVGAVHGAGGPQRGSRRRRIVRRVAEYVERQPSWLLFGLAIGLVALVGWADYATGAALSFAPFYLVPVCVITWVLGRRAGVAIALACGICWTLAYVYGGPGVRWDSAGLYWNIGAQLSIFLVAGLVVSGLREALNKEKELARTDPITGAPNSRAFFEHLERELDRSLRYGRPFTVAYLDADNFKEVNDRFGHGVGDALLKAVAGTVRTNIRTTDFVARIAGDEFTVLLPETGRKEAELVMTRVRLALATAVQSSACPVTFSIGVVTYATPPATVDALVNIADDLMYRVKRSGKNSVRHAVYGERKGAA